MRLSQYAKQMGVSYKTAFRWWKAGKLDAYQLDTGTVIVREPAQASEAKGVALYARVSSAEQKADLERQMQRLKDYAASRGYHVTKAVSELASGLNDSPRAPALGALTIRVLIAALPAWTGCIVSFGMDRRRIDRF